MKHTRRWVPMISIAGVFVVLVSAFLLVYFVMDRVYSQIGQTPTPWLAQVINSLLGLVLIIAVIGTLGYIFGGKRRAMQMGVFAPILDALGKIAQGDFSVRLDNDLHNFRSDEPVGLLVESVNTLAHELNQMEAMRQEFISNVSHEIQSPLTSIRGFARALQDDRLAPAERAHYLNVIETESTRLSKLSENLLALALLDSESYALDRKSFRLDEQIRDVVLACEPQWQDKQLELDITAEPTTLYASQDLLSQVWANLIHNSIKFTPTSGKIWIELHPSAGTVTFRISDTGIGIGIADQEHVFERFFKADKARERSRGGSGLGLAIAKEIVEMHHGTIAVASKLDTGTTFTVTLPMSA